MEVRSEEMDMHPSSESRFVCPNCGHDLEADEAVQQAVVEHGCVVCGARPSDRMTATGTGSESAG